MKTLTISTLAALLLSSISTPAAEHVTPGVNMGIRVHQNHSIFEEYAFDDNDVSFKLDYRVSRSPGYVEIGTLITPDAGGDDDYGLVFTPGIAAILQDGGFFGGFRYQKTFDDGLSGISGWYWDLSLGYAWELSDTLALDLSTSYPFEHFDDFSDFDSGDLEYVVGLTFSL